MPTPSRQDFQHSQLPCREVIHALLVESKGTTNLIYTFPRKLASCFRTGEKDAAPSLLDSGSAIRELAFSGFTHERNQVAIRQHNSEISLSVVNFNFLDEAPSPITADHCRIDGVKCPEKAAEEYNKVLTPHYRYCQGYCGWLLQQSAYWRDLKTVVDKVGNDLNGGPLPQQVFTPPTEAVLVEDVGARSATLAFKAFCDKWRLQGLATLDLPIVLEPQYTATTIYDPCSSPNSISPHIPDIFPIDAKGTIASVLESARMSIDAPHLEEWKTIIGTSSREKKKVDRFARQFSLQHYWRVLLQRYPGQLKKRKSVIEEAFAKYFRVDPTVIRRDTQAMSILIDRNLSTFL